VIETRRLPDAVCLVALVALAVVAAALWTSPPQWKTDSLFYQAHVYEVEGDSHAVAYRKVFAGPLSLSRRQADAGLPLALRRVGNPKWVAYSERFYERRWFVPAVAAAISPIFGTDALRMTSLLAFVLLGPALYLLLRLRAPRPIAFAVAAAGLLLAPVLFHAGLPLLDVAGATLETAAAAGALLALESSLWWLMLWGAALGALSLTRDSSVILGLSAVWLAVRERSRRSLLVVAVGGVAALPAPLLLGAPIREAMAYTFGVYYEQPDSSWGWVAARYWPNLRRLARYNVTYLEHHPFTALYLVGGYLALFVIRARGDRFIRFFRAAALSSILFDALQPVYTAFRLELTFVPIAAAGLAVGATSLYRAQAQRSSVLSRAR
jgi:hypothetical protein